MRYRRMALIGFVSFFTMAFVFADGTGAMASGPTLYGAQERPLMDRGTRLNVYGPGEGTIVRIDGSTTEVPLADHLSSFRVMAGAAATHHEYGPYGATTSGDSDVVYAGHPYNAHQGAYVTPSRRYDASSGRFLSRDPAPGLSNPGSSDPYSYANGDPVNQLDPDGRATTYFFLHSKIDGTIRYPDGHTVPRYQDIVHVAHTEHRLPVIAATLETSARTPFLTNPGSGRHHLTIVVPGAAGGKVTVKDVISSRTISMTGSEFASYLSYRMQQQFGNVSDHIRSISLFRCQNACRRPSGGPTEPSFAEDFARAARPDFPRLREVIASPYEIDAVELQREGIRGGVGLLVRTNADHESLVHRIDPQHLFGGNFSEDLFHPPTSSMFHGVNELVPTPGRPDRTYLQFSSDSNRVHSFMDLHRNELTEPLLRSIPVETPTVE